jgi:hypothetical protein
MKGVGSAYGFEPVTEIGARIETASAAGDREEVRRQLDRLADYLDRVDVVTG